VVVAAQSRDTTLFLARRGQDLIRPILVTLRGLILRALRWKERTEAAGVLPQTAGLLPCAGFVYTWVMGTPGVEYHSEKRREHMSTRWWVLLLGLGLLSACTVLPTGPSVLVLPAVGKPMDVFQAEEGGCRSYTQQQIGVTAEQAAGAAAAMTLQSQYDRAYIQCMYAKGNVVPGVVVASGPSFTLPPPGTPPPPSTPALPPRGTPQR